MMKKSTSSLAMYVATGALSLSATAATLLFNVSDARACDGDPPPPQCGVALGCVLAVGETGAANQGAAVDVDVQAAMNLVITGDDPRCPSQTGALDVSVDAVCEDPTGAMAPGGVGSAMATLNNGMNNVTIPVSFQAGGERTCQIDGTANVTLSSGQTASATCSEQCIALVPPAGSAPTTPGIELRLKDPDWINGHRAGHPVLVVYEVVNNTDVEFTGNVEVSLANAVSTATAGPVPAPSPDPATVCPSEAPEPPTTPADCSAAQGTPVCGCDGNVYENRCLMGNAGVALYDADATHDFCNPPLPAAVFEVASGDPKKDTFNSVLLQPGQDPCIPQQDNALDTGSMDHSTAITVGPGQTAEFTLASRSSGACLDGSCNRLTVELTGALASGDVVASCGGGAIVVDDTITIPDAECPDSPTTDPVCAANDPCCNADDGVCDDDGEPMDPETPVCDTAVDADCDNLTDDVDPNPMDDDADDDNIPDDIEIQTGTDPNDNDSDDDNIPDDVEIDNGTDPNNNDSDGDGLTDDIEIQTGSLPLDDDTDNDGIPDGLDDDVFNPDVDGDGILDGDDDDLNTPRGVDSDGDGITDATETNIYGSDPNSLDSDGDGLSDADEVNVHRTHPALVDTDGDGLADNVEVNTIGTNPIVADSDHDGLSDGDEVHVHGTNPLLGDTDGAGARDGDEIANGYDPTDVSDDVLLLNNRMSRAALVIQSEDPLKSIKLVKDHTKMLALDVRRQYSSIQNLTSRVGRIHETLEINAASMPAAGQTFGVEVQFSAKLDRSESSFNVQDLVMGLKRTDMNDAVKGEGSLELDSKPNTLFNVEYVGSVWAANPTTGAIERLVVNNPTFNANTTENTFSATFEVVAPGFETSTLYFMSDIQGNELADYETSCVDGSDDDNDGAVDCQDTDCAQDAACQDGTMEVCGDFIDNDGDGAVDCADSDCAGVVSCQTEICGDGVDNDSNGLLDCADPACNGDAACPTTGGPTPGFEDEPEGCACNSTGDGSLPLGSLALLGLGLVGLRRRRKQD